jgi:hypothetical protein
MIMEPTLNSMNFFYTSSATLVTRLAGQLRLWGLITIAQGVSGTKFVFITNGQLTMV